MVILKLIGAMVVFILVLVGQLWFLAQVEPPGGQKARVVYLILCVAIAAMFAWASMQHSIGDDY